MSDWRGGDPVVSGPRKVGMESTMSHREHSNGKGEAAVLPGDARMGIVCFEIESH